MMGIKLFQPCMKSIFCMSMMALSNSSFKTLQGSVDQSNLETQNRKRFLSKGSQSKEIPDIIVSQKDKTPSQPLVKKQTIKNIEEQVVPASSVKPKSIINQSPEAKLASFNDFMQFISEKAAEQSKELKSKVESLTHSKPDFGYPEQMTFEMTRKDGWAFFLDMISRYRQKEKITNTIKHFNEEKRLWKEEEIKKMSQNVSKLANSHSNTNNPKKTLHMQQPVVLKNTPHQNWLLWHFQKGKRQVALTPAELKMQKLKKEAIQLMENQQRDSQWFDNYRGLVGIHKPIKSEVEYPTRSIHQSLYTPKQQQDLEELRRLGSVQVWNKQTGQSYNFVKHRAQSPKPHWLYLVNRRETNSSISQKRLRDIADVRLYIKIFFSKFPPTFIISHNPQYRSVIVVQHQRFSQIFLRLFSLDFINTHLSFDNISCGE